MLPHVLYASASLTPSLSLCQTKWFFWEVLFSIVFELWDNGFLASSVLPWTVMFACSNVEAELGWFASDSWFSVFALKWCLLLSKAPFEYGSNFFSFFLFSFWFRNVIRLMSSMLGFAFAVGGTFGLLMISLEGFSLWLEQTSGS